MSKIAFNESFAYSDKNRFLTSFYAFPKKVVKDKFVAREVPDNPGFLIFEKAKKFSCRLAFFRFRFNTSEVRSGNLNSEGKFRPKAAKVP